MASCLWRFICDRASHTPMGSSHDAGDIVLQLSKGLAPAAPDEGLLPNLAAHLTTLLDVLALPPGKIINPRLAYIPVTLGLLRSYGEQVDREPTIAETVALISQSAYLETIRTFLSQSKFQAWLSAIRDRPVSEATQQALMALDSFELSDLEARRAIPYFHESPLAQAYSAVLVARLGDWGVKPEQAAKVSVQLARQTSRLMLSVLIKHSPAARTLVEWYQLHGGIVFDKYLGIDAYLESWIAPRPRDPVFAEPFTLQDIYIPLKAQPLTATGEQDTSQGPMVLEDWAQWLLKETAHTGQVMIVWGEPGRGKSVFAQMFADWVRRHGRHDWIPILIPLRTAAAADPFEDFLAAAVGPDVTQGNAGWLTDYNLNFVFILDGLNDLPVETTRRDGELRFLQQAIQFQADCAQDPAKGHRLLITSRSSGLRSLKAELPANLMHIEILPLDKRTRLQWFKRWESLLAPDQPHLLKALDDKRLPAWLLDLTQEPLMLYVLAAMYRDKDLRPEMLAWLDGNQAKMLFYERMLAWALTGQAAEHPKRPAKASLQLSDSRALQPSPSLIRRILQEAALFTLQFGSEFGALAPAQGTLSDRAVSYPTAQLWHAIARFYLQPGESHMPLQSVRTRFGELLCAERIVTRLTESCAPGRDCEYAVDDGTFCWTLYDLLGFPSLSAGILEQLMFMLSRHPDLETGRLQRRLCDFYWRWSQGEFMDAPPENLPQQKMRLLQARAPRPGESLGQRQIDTLTGLNTLTLLLHLHRYGRYLAEAQAEEASTPANSLAFHPCSHPDGQRFDPQQLLKLIGLSYCLGTIAFRDKVGPFLTGADLTNADLQSTDLMGANLEKAALSGVKFRNANLHRANLRTVDLRRADLKGANLSDADLKNAKLPRTDLTGANLKHASLNLTDLSRACLSNADLRGASLINAILFNVNLTSANLSRADLNGANLSQANLSDADLRSASLVNASLINVSLISADLRSAILKKATLSGADFRSAQLSSADLTEAELSGANLSGTNLSNAELVGARLCGVNLFEAKLFEATLRNSDLSGANLFQANLGSADLQEATLNSADLSQANLFEATLTGADLNNADLFEANLTGANLSEAAVCGADLRSTQLTEARLVGTNLSQANLFNACLRGADLRGANLSGANLCGVDLSEADLTGAVLSDEHETVRWDEHTTWHGVEGLDTAIGLPHRLMRQVGVFTPDAPHPDLIMQD